MSNNAMHKEEKYLTLKEIVRRYLPEDVSIDDLTPESHLMNELNINSAHLVDIVLDVEDAFDIRLENDDMNELQTVSDALRIIERKIASKLNPE
ncbi:phosphopantetheine-binding protein [Arenibacter sp. GZD96]|uniref:acyl carrier protein n=1 Tax=Aurantibrevibacter litoralis TaxID=3106030 RepID=UPI002B003CC4|nr:phosphopantetheine-binding protein [Arenibacter sp. GZD-96]MEA1786390.1 phosphopantetheine-binding protein [Arenibacter sp. GZD-96]